MRSISLLRRLYVVIVYLLVEVVWKGRDPLASYMELKQRCDQLLAANQRLKDDNRHLNEQAHTDPTTMALNARGCFFVLEREINRARRSKTPLSLIYMDLDGLKFINDTRGHEAGNSLLRAFVENMRKASRLYDSVARVGGDEFVLVLPEMDQTEAERVVQRLADNARFEGEPIAFSYGIVQLDDPTCDCGSAEAMIRHADQRMYDHKKLKRTADVPVATGS